MNSDEDLSGRILDTLKKAERERSITRVPTPMTVSLLLYAKAEADCSLWINGSKYIKGDCIDGLYPIESINTEGVVLSPRESGPPFARRNDRWRLSMSGGPSFGLGAEEAL